MVTTEGLNAILDIALSDDAKNAAYYVGLISSSSYTGISESDTMSSHSGWTELTSYDESSRPTLTFGNPSAGILNNPSAVQFTPSAAATCVGYFITTNSTKGGTTGTLIVVDTFAEGTRSLLEDVIEALLIQIVARNA